MTTGHTDMYRVHVSYCVDLAADCRATAERMALSVLHESIFDTVVVTVKSEALTDETRVSE